MTKLDAELEKIRQTNVGTDNEEFIEGMAAAAVPVWDLTRQDLRDGCRTWSDRPTAGRRASRSHRPEEGRGAAVADICASCDE